MSFLFLAGIGFAVCLLIYLAYALINPEKF
jgi:K+-transporting ATPase KdpF subunit